MKDSLGDRMKHNYESRSQTYLTRRTPVLLRLDGNCFHTLTKGLPAFDPHFSNTMENVAHSLMKRIQGCELAYVQSDEISLLLVDYKRLESEAWFDYNVQKICSIGAGIATAFFNVQWNKYHDTLGWFDCRAFNVPANDVNNYFLWRQKDCMRNSLSMLAQEHFSHKELQGKNGQAMHDMLHSVGVNWNDLDPVFKVGRTITKDKNWPHEFQVNPGIVNQIVGVI